MATSRAGRLSIALALILLTAACGSGRLAPLPVPLDHVSCSRCGMLVSDGRTAAQALAAGEEPRFYDDIGCAAADTTLPAAGAIYVSSGAGKWLSADRAYYARAADSRTPMGYGVIAFASPDAARSRDKDGRALSWTDLTARIRAGGLR